MWLTCLSLSVVYSGRCRWRWRWEMHPLLVLKNSSGSTTKQVRCWETPRAPKHEETAHYLLLSFSVKARFNYSVTVEIRSRYPGIILLWLQRKLYYNQKLIISSSGDMWNVCNGIKYSNPLVNSLERSSAQSFYIPASAAGTELSVQDERNLFCFSK